MINAVKKPLNITNGKEKSGVYYYAAYSRKGTADTIALAEQMNEGSSAFTKGEVVGITLDLPIRIRQAMLAGQAVHINGLGTFKPALTVSDVKKNPDDLKTSAISIKGINFKPDADLVNYLNQRATYEWISIDKASAEDDDPTDAPPTEGNSPTDTDQPSGSTTPPSSESDDHVEW